MNMDQRTQALLQAPPFPLLVRLATPNTLAFFIQSGVSITEVWFIGQLGTVSLAAIALAFPLLMLTQTMSGGAFGGAVASAIARALGAGDRERAQRLIWHAFALAGLGAGLFLLLFLLGGRAFLAFIGGSGEVLDQAASYCTVLFLGAIFIWLLGIVSAIYRGMGEMRLPAQLMLLSAFIQVPVSGVLILGAFGMPSYGIVGAAVSAIGSGLVVSLIMILRLRAPGWPLQLQLSDCVFSRRQFHDILQVAMPASLSPLLTVATVLCLTAVVGTFGDAALAGYGIGSRVEFLMIPLVFGLGAAMTSMVGTNIGAGNVQRAERIGFLGGACAAAIAGMIGLLLALFPDAWISQFTSDPATQASARTYIYIVGPCFAFHGLGLSLYFASQGANAMVWPVAATALRITVAVGGALILGLNTTLGLAGVYTAAALAMSLYGIIIAASVRLGAWRKWRPLT